jgi:hypothetical protein
MNELIDDRVRDELHAALGAGPTVERDWADVDRRLGSALRRRQRRRLAVATAVVVVAALVVWTAHGSTHPRVRTGPVSRSNLTTTTAPGTTTSTAAPLEAAVHVVSRTPIFAPGVLVATGDGAWVITGNIVGGAPAVVHVSSAGRVLSTTVLPGVTQGPIYLASGEGSVWAATWDGGTLFRIDPSNGRITGTERLRTAGLSGEVEWVAAGLGHVYVTMCCDQPNGPNQRLIQLDPSTLRPQGETGVRGAGENERVVVGAQDVFVTGEDFDKVDVIDPANLHGHEVGVEGGAGPVTVAGSSVLVIGRWFPPVGTGFTLATIDPVALSSHHLLSWPAEGVGQIAAGTGVVWGRETNSGRIFAVVDGRMREVPGTEGTQAGVIAAESDRLWALEGGVLVQYRRS